MEDDPAIRKLLTRCIKGMGWEVVAVAGSSEAHHYFQAGRFQVLLSDVDLPGNKNGIALAKEFSLVDPGIKVIMMSGLPSNEDRAKQVGLDIFLHKPLDLSKLTALLKLFRVCRNGSLPSKPDPVLLVEDDAAVREMLAQYIHAAGWEVVSTRNGEEALQAFQRGKFSMLVADVRLDDEMDGIEVAKRLLSFEPKLKVAMISGVPGASERVKEAGLTLFFPKPIGINALAELLELDRAHYENGVTKHILVIEDDPVQLNEYCLMLRGRGYRVTGVQSAEDALKRMESVHFDAILTDNILPGMTGLRAIQEMKKRSKAPVVLMTSHPSPNLERDALLLGASAFFAKPLDIEQLDSKLKSTLT